MIAARLFACSGAKIAAAIQWQQEDSVSNSTPLETRLTYTFGSRTWPGSSTKIFLPGWLTFLRSLPTFTVRTAPPAEEKGGRMMTARSRGGATLLLSFL